MKIIRTDQELEMPLVDQRLQDEGHTLTLLHDGISEDQLCAAVSDCELLLMCYTPITKRVIESAPKLKAIVKYGVGIDAIDIPAANANGVIVVNIPEYAEETVAEGAFTMLIALAKKLLPINNEMQKRDWAWPTQRWMGLDLAEKTIGIIGCGKIGKSMARMCGAGFRMKVLGYDPYVSKENLASHGIIKVDKLDELLPHCDFVSLHATLSHQSIHIIGKDELKAMQQQAFIINSARGALIDEKALIEALENKEIAGAGIDVFSQEPVDQTNHLFRSLYQLDNVIMFPHLTFYTKEAMERLEIETLQRCYEVIEEKPVHIKSDDERLHQQHHLRTTYTTPPLVSM
jgi:D-3-phosphoglycerate dehydrogenase